MASFAPESILKLVVEAFSSEEVPAYSQVSTVDQWGDPALRTVHVRYALDRRTIGFATHVKSAKWTQLQHHPVVSGCYYDTLRQVQFRWTSNVDLLTYNENDASLVRFLTSQWNLSRETVRAVYWHDYLGLGSEVDLPADVSLEQCCPNYSYVLCWPRAWDIYELRSVNYFEHRRTAYSLVGEKWSSQPLVVINGRPISL